MAFLPDFGWCTCSATGDTVQEVLDSLKEVQREIIKYYLDIGKKYQDLQIQTDLNIFILELIKIYLNKIIAKFYFWSI